LLGGGGGGGVIYISLLDGHGWQVLSEHSSKCLAILVGVILLLMRSRFNFLGVLGSLLDRGSFFEHTCEYADETGEDT